MKKIHPKNPAALEHIRGSILLIRGKRVMLDSDLARLYGVSTKRLNEQVKRNRDRFPEDFMFQLNKTDLKEWRSHFATSNLTLRKTTLIQIFPSMRGHEALARGVRSTTS